MDPSEIQVGQRIEVELPGVPAWNVPKVTSTATVTEDNIDALKADVAEQIEKGGATLRRLG